MRKETKEDIIFGVKALLILITIFGAIFILLYVIISSKEKETQDARYKKIQSYTYVVVDGIYFESSKIKEFENKSGRYCRTYIFVLKDGTEIETDGYILTNRRNLK